MFCCRALFLWLACVGLLPTILFAGPSNSLLDISTDGELIACSNRDSGTVSIVRAKDLKKLAEVEVGEHPEGVSFLGSSHQLAVAIYAEDKVVFVDADEAKVTGQVEVFDEPYGVVSSRDGRLFVTLDYPGGIVELDAVAKKVVREISGEPFLRGIALSIDEKQAYVTNYYSAELLAIDLESGKIADRWPGMGQDNLARQVAVHPTRPKVYFPHIRSRVTAVHGEGSIFPYVSIADTRPADPNKPEEKRRRRVPMDSFRGAFVTANPWELAVSPNGKQLVVVFAGTDDMFITDVIDDDYREIGYRDLKQTGRNPRAVKFSPDGRTFYLYNALDFEIVAYSAAAMRIEGRVTVTKYPHSPEMLRGKVLFYSANEPMASRRWISCASCHPDGDPDGKTWHNPEGLRNTQALTGMAWTHPIHWSADRDEVQDFEHTIRGKLMQGRGLLRGELKPELGGPNSGLSNDLDALAIYSNSHHFALSPHAKGGLSDEAKRGKEIFFSKEVKCAECHHGAYFCDSQPSEVTKIKRHDVGTGEDDPGEKMGPAYDTPTLLGVYRTAPYLHHGKAKTLEELLTTCNKGDRHGRTSQLSSDQINDLVAFLKSLPYEDPEPAAVAAGLKKVEK